MAHPLTVPAPSSLRRVREDGVLIRDADEAPAHGGDVPGTEGRVRRGVNVVFAVAVLLDILAQATHLVPHGSSLAFATILALVALPAAVLLLAQSRGRRRSR
jgi:hypothetical protein